MHQYALENTNWAETHLLPFPPLNPPRGEELPVGLILQIGLIGLISLMGK